MVSYGTKDVYCIGVGVISGSTVSFQLIIKFLENNSIGYRACIVSVLYLSRRVIVGTLEVFAHYAKILIIEIEGKMKCESENIYLALSNYHVSMESNFYFSLSTREEKVNASSLPIYMTFFAWSSIFKRKICGIIQSPTKQEEIDVLKFIAV